MNINIRVTSFFGEDEVLGSYIARLFPFMISVLIFSQESLILKLILFYIYSYFYQHH